MPKKLIECLKRVSVVATILLSTHTVAGGFNTLTGKPISERYRKQFVECDKSNKFGTVQLPLFSKRTGKIAWFPCKSDPSRFERFEKIAGADSFTAILVSSKLGRDEDGSPRACSGARGPTDQCPTSLMLNSSSTKPCAIRTRSGKFCVPLNADEIAYVVMPMAAPPGIDGTEFQRLSGISIGDYGVVIANGRIVPVIVGDGGPAYKIGEGSTALLKALSTDGKAHTISGGVIFILFPGTHDVVGSLSPDTLAAEIQRKGNELYKSLMSNHS